MDKYFMAFGCVWFGFLLGAAFMAFVHGFSKKFGGDDDLEQMRRKQ